MIPSAAKNTNQVIERILVKLTNDCDITDFELRRFIRDAESQVDPERMYIVKALAYTVHGSRDDAREQALFALESLQQEATLTHALLVLQCNGFHREILDFMKDNKVLFSRCGFYDSLASVLVALPNVDYIRIIKETLTKLDRNAEAGSLMKLCDFFISNVERAESEFNIPQSTVGEISEFAAEVADKYEGVVINRSAFTLSPSGEWFSLTYYVELKDSLLVDLNLDLADLVIDRGLDTLPLVSKFEVIPAGADRVRCKYAN
ncbi:hypothetical protein [Vibrio crassostreae]|uniref:hypothetical protein n=1 Tax=Vibrio crassostreae TaxID=246167 RepID=UPI000634A6DA|nr:hypothetical protein [Vibrio crassostreae]CAH6804802.1 conserved hypothetical protein [Vibrio chagasii]CAH6814904.1 conserved hypothetical protein [Vibrio chagasii]CAH6819565.1 conserved hypothetical protein [Vibrio chagasii]CAH6826797.1 conserved hypothetical protein [Vibrio chagasii]CAH6862026.1 conserved hypothetical protein [Vibrio chagasii]